MKVVFKKTAVDRLLEEIYKAERDCKKIDYIMVSHEEMAELHAYGKRYCSYPFEMYKPSDFFGLEMSIRVADVPQRDGRVMRFPMSDVKFHGVDLAVVPKHLQGG